MANHLLFPAFAKSSPITCPYFCQIEHWMLGLAKMSPTAFVLSMSITTYPHFCQTKHLDAWFGKNEPHHSPPFFKTQTRKTQPIWLRLLSLGSSLLLFYMFSTKPCIFRFNV